MSENTQDAAHLSIRNEKMSLLIGTMIGQMSELLNHIKGGQIRRDEIYNNLFDIHTSAALQLHELFYKKTTVPQNNWIDVKVVLPAMKQMVLTYCPDYSPMPIKVNYINGWDQQWAYDCTRKITHWMPLVPAPNE
ncbi:MAG TPA: DUF551 domain-containing protein [Hanamia sp.]|jgi:Protein of unknown function (DUF551).|nr:DUF551 domain-containing protein [Hanamia sp.]